MTTPADACNDDLRLKALADLDIMDSPPEPAFDRLTSLCRKIFQVPMSTLTFIDGHRQWFKAREGVADQQTERRPALWRGPFAFVMKRWQCRRR